MAAAKPLDRKKRVQMEKEEKNNSLLKIFGSLFQRKTFMSGLLPASLCCKGIRWQVGFFMGP